MSLPSYALFVDENDTPLAYGFCNIGWFVDERYLPRCVDEALEQAIKGEPEESGYILRHYDGDDVIWDPEWQTKWTHVKLYGYTLPRDKLAQDYRRRMEEAGKVIEND